MINILIALFTLLTPTAAESKIDWEPTTLKLPNGQEIAAEKGSLTVPENRSRKGGKKITLAVLRVKTQTENPKAPLTYLAGGPGGSAIRMAGPLVLGLQDELKDRDLILMDQRGTGLSQPALRMAAESPFPIDGFVDQQKAEAYYMANMKKAVTKFKAAGHDLHAYNTEESADDLDAMRRAIGAEKLAIMGFSYGTHYALNYLRRHEAHVERLVLVGTEGPNNTYKYPMQFNQQLKKLSDLVAADPKMSAKVPNMFQLYQDVKASLDKQPIELVIRPRGSEEPISIRFGSLGLQIIFRLDLGDGNDYIHFPKMLYDMKQGNFDLISRYAAKRYWQFSRGVAIMPIVMDASSGASPGRLLDIEAQIAEGVVGNVLNTTRQDIRELLGIRDLGFDYRKPLGSHVPTLFISGTMDANAPPYQAEQVRFGFANGTHIIVKNAGHEDMLPNPEVQAVIKAFLRGEKVVEKAIYLPKITFTPIGN